MNKKISVIILSLLYTLFCVVGISFMASNSFKYLTKNFFLVIIITLVLFIIFYFLLTKLFNYLDKYKTNELKVSNKLLILFDKHPILFSFIIMILAWLIYLIAFYPAILSPDPSFQLLQYFGIDNKYSSYVVLLDKNVIITNHHPVIHTLLLGTCANIGLILFNDINIGLFIYSIIQTIILALTLSYTIFFMKKINTSLKYQIICLLIYALVPVFPLYAMSPVKDVIFGCLVILYIIQFYKYLTNIESLNIKSIIRTLILIILVILFRNNGIHLVILTFPLLILFCKKHYKVYSIMTLIIITIFITYSKIVLPFFKITPSSIRETLSIPFQQTARYVSSYDDEVTKKEKEKIDKILTYDTLKERYNPEKADPVKNEYNRYATNEDLKEYFKVWFNMFTKHPMCYVEATINNTYGYFYPVKTNWYVYYKYNKTLKDNNIDYHYNSLSSLRNSLSTYGRSFPYIPILGLIVNIGFNNWLLIFMFIYLIYKKKYHEMFYLIPSFVLTLVCIASPVNAYFRYALPNVFAIPTLLAIFIHIIKKKELEKSI